MKGKGERDKQRNKTTAVCSLGRRTAIVPPNRALWACTSCVSSIVSLLIADGLLLDVSLLGNGAIREIAAASQAQAGFRHEGCLQKGGVHRDDSNGAVQVGDAATDGEHTIFLWRS